MAETTELQAKCNHDFELHSFATFTYCNFCGNFIWGLRKQGFRCKKCHYAAHKACRMYATPPKNKQSVPKTEPNSIIAKPVAKTDGQILEGMGFPKDECAKALIITGGDVEAAAALLKKKQEESQSGAPPTAATAAATTAPVTERTNAPVSVFIRASAGGQLLRSQMLESMSVAVSAEAKDDSDDEKDEVYEKDEWFLDDGPVEEEKLFEVLEKEKLEEMMLADVTHVANMLELDKGEASLILREFQWSLDRFENLYFDNPAKYNASAGVIIPTTGAKDKTTPGDDDEEEFECPVCMNDVPAADAVALGCGHRFCIECWQNHLKVNAESLGANCTRATCMSSDCPAVIPYTVWQRLAEPAVFDRFWYFFMKDFVERNKQYVFCINPKCGRAIHCKEVVMNAPVVECECGARFCFQCGQEKHNPATCKQLAQWQERLSSDDDSMKMIKATTKPCFHCGWPTERNNGCNHMTCSQCHGEWCWMCRGDWKTHGQHTGGFFSCNRYATSEAKKLDEWADQYKKSNERYQHYYSRYFNHDSSRKELENKVESLRQAAAAQSRKTGVSYDDVNDAIKLAIDCRTVLKYTYVYGFFLEDPDMLAFFEYLQANAEGITERLCEIINKPVEEIALEELRDRVSITKKYFTNLVTGIEEGLIPRK